MKRYKAILLLICVWGFIPAQSQPLLTLEDAIDKVLEHSLLARKARYQYQADYWRFQSFRADLKPQIGLSSVPVSFNRAVVERYDSELNRDIYREQQTLNNRLSLSVTQQIPQTGGNIYVETDFGRLQTFGDHGFVNYFSVPFRIGFDQQIGGFQELKWKRQIEQMQFQQSKQVYLLAQEELTQETVAQFFDLAEQQLNVKIARFNLQNTDTLYQIGRERNRLGTLTQDDLLELEMSLIEAKASLQEGLAYLELAQQRFQNLLQEPGTFLYELVLPESIFDFHIDPEFACRAGGTVHPRLMEYRLQMLAAAQEIDRSRKENGFQMNVSTSFGINQLSDQLNGSYQFPMDQQQFVFLSLDLPLWDWGKRKSEIHLAEAQRDQLAAEVEQQRFDYFQEIRTAAASFNLQANRVNNARRLIDLAAQRYEVTQRRFLIGKVDLLKLTSSLRSRNLAQRGYLESLREYWSSYYLVRQLTLYDFAHQQALQFSTTGLAVPTGKK